MGDEHQRPPHPGLKGKELVLHVAADQRVERRERLVEEQDLRFHAQSPGQAHPLLHAAGELLGEVVGPVAQAYHRQHLQSPLVAVRFGRALYLEAEGDVVDHFAVGEQTEVLEHHRQALPPQFPQLLIVQVADRRAVDLHGPAGRLDQPGQASDQSRLARAGEAHDDEGLSPLHREGRVPHRHQAAGLVEDHLPVAALGEESAGGCQVVAEHLGDLLALQGRLLGGHHRANVVAARPALHTARMRHHKTLFT